MGHHRHGLGLLFALLLLPLGCSSAVRPVADSANAPKIRVRLLAGVESATLSCGVPPLYQFSNQPVAQLLNSPKNSVVALSLTSQGWQANNATLGGSPADALRLQPDRDGSVSVNGVPYRGKFRL